MYICEFNKDDIQNIVIQHLRLNGIKHRQKKYTYKHDKSVNKTVKRIFKVPLHLLPTENITNHGFDVKIPCFVFEACKLISMNIQTEGLFRKAGSNVRQKEIKSQLDNKGKLNKDHHVIDIANVLKLFFRELPEPLIPYMFHDTFLHCLRVEKQLIVSTILLTCLLLPIENLYTLAYVMEFLNNVAANAEHNKMDISNLSIILTPSIMPLEAHMKMSAQSNQRLTYHVRVVQILIEHAANIGVVPLEIVEKIPISRSNSQEILDTDGGDGDKKKKKKRRSGSLTRMFNGLKKIVSGRIASENGNGIMMEQNECTPSPDLLMTTPCLKKVTSSSSNKRRANDVDIYGLSSKKRRNTFGKWFATSTPISKTVVAPPNQETSSKQSLLSGHKIKRSSFDDIVTPSDKSALKRLERRWSVVSSASVWGKKKKQTHASIINNDPPLFTGSIENEINHVDDDVFLANNNSLIHREEVNNDIEFVRIPKQEYEEIKSRVSAIENRISQEFNNIPPTSSSTVTNDLVKDVQTEYEKTLEESSTLNNASTDQLAKRLSRELKIRRNSDQQKVIRSPSARKIGTIRRRSKEFDRKNSRIERNHSWHLSGNPEISSIPKSALRRGRPNTIFSGLPQPNTSKLVNEVYLPVTTSLGTPKTEESSEKIDSSWKGGERFFSVDYQTPRSNENTIGPRSSLAKLRSQNAGMVLAKAKLFDGLLDSSKDSSCESLSIVNRRQSGRLMRQNKTRTSPNTSTKRNNKNRKHNKENDYENLPKKSTDSTFQTPPPNTQIVFATPKITPQIKKTLVNVKSPKYLRQTASGLSLSAKKTPFNTKTPLKAIHGLQQVNGNTPRRCSPRLLLKTKQLSSAC
ncbi:uncharacterized protein LOC123294171 [Chrysoperla carnea]|uniref:uncharacterized protein LOC123294171 n=1 Tax=Chrysoperla carnea TaxID=189513 RepID=UPI001D0929BF|nr:uncharacterized protein LOC123294171 [Chrysoperla carnea]